MSRVRLWGHDAVHYAEAHHLGLHRASGDPGQAERELSVEDAQKLPDEEASTLYVEFDWPVAPSEEL